MKALVFFAATALIALPLLAGEAKPQTDTAPQTATAVQQPATPAGVKKSVARPAAVEDSPLVAAAKRSTAARKKSTMVITNDNLGGKNAKVTTTATQEPLILGARSAAPPEPPDLQRTLAQIQKNKDAVAEQKRAESEAAKAKRMQELRGRLEDDGLYSDVDPAQLEHQLERTSTQDQQPPPPKNP
jgi:hypothetical protein